MATRTASAGPKQNHNAVTAVVCIALATVVSAMASLNVALPDIARSTHASQTQLQWIIDAYSLMFAALLLPAGAIGDRYGRRRALLIGLTIFGAGSVAAMTISSAPWLIVLRGLLGVGASLVMPATLSTITSTFPPAQRAKAVAVWAGVAGGSAVLGLLTAGALLEGWHWQSVFLLNVVLAAIAIVGTLKFVPESADKDAPRLDGVGAAIAAVGLIALVYSIIEAPESGWVSARTLVGLGAGLLILAGFIAWELRQRFPMLDPRVFAHRTLSAGSLSIFIQFFAFFGFTFTILQYLQGVRGYSPLIAAVCLLPLAAALMPTSRLTPKLAERFGTRPVCVIGLILIAVGLAVIAMVGSDTGYWLLLVGLIPLGVGMGLAMTPATASITEALPSSQQGVGSALNDLSRELGGAIGIAVIGSILTAGYRSHFHVTGLPQAILDKARDSFAVGIHIGGPVTTHAQSAFMSGMHVAMLVGAGSAVVAAVVVGWLLRRSGPQETVAVVGQRESVENEAEVATA